MSSEQDRIRVAVVTGGHSYDVPSFHGLFRQMPEVDAYIQHMDDFASSPEAVRDSYDVVVFYIMLMDGPSDEGLPWYAGKPAEAVAHLGATAQGILVLHHAILAYPNSFEWRDITGVDGHTFDYFIGETVHVDVADGAHPITSGLQAWDMIDETYTMSEPGADSTVLLTVDHEKSMKSIAWTRQHGKSRVLCLQSGHDNDTWQNMGFREVLRRGIRWCAGQI